MFDLWYDVLTSLTLNPDHLKTLINVMAVSSCACLVPFSYLFPPLYPLPPLHPFIFSVIYKILLCYLVSMIIGSQLSL